MTLLPLLATGLLLALLALLAWELLQILRAKAPPTVAERLVGQGAPRKAAIPKVIWAYWHEPVPPPFIARCLANWQRLAPDYELRLLHRHALADWLPQADLAATLDALPPYRQADWLRLQLLARHGGIWIDASTLLTRDLAWVHALQARDASEFVGFWIDRYTNAPERPIVENWFMAAVPGSRFVADLATEFDAALAAGSEAYLQALRAQGRLARVVQDLTPDFQHYLLMHVAASKLLERAPEAYRLSLQRAEDVAFALHRALRWRKRHLYARLALTPCPARLPALIKLRGAERGLAERGLARGRWIAGSAFARLLELRR